MPDSSPLPPRGRGLWRRVSKLNIVGVAALLLAGGLLVAGNLPDDSPNQLFNVSYDPT